MTNASDRWSLMTTLSILFCAVWLMYLLDRLLDCRRLDFSQEVPHRHRFVHRWSFVLWPVWSMVFAVTAVIAIWFLDWWLLCAGGVLLGSIAIYYWAVHGDGSTRRCLPKEFFVGILFAIGTSLPIALQQLTVGLSISIVLLAALCILNCLCVARAQESSDRQQHMGSAVLLYPSLGQRLPYVAACVVAAAAILGWGQLIPAAMAIATLISGSGLMCLAWLMERPHGTTNLSSWGPMADYVLLTPLLLWTING